MERTVSGLGLAVLALAGTTAGFLAASVPTASPTTTEAIVPGQALRLEPTPERLHLATADDAPAQVLVFDANTSYRDRIRLDPGDGSQELPGLPGNGTVLLVPKASGAVRIQLPADAGTEARREPVYETRHPLLVGNRSAVSEVVTVSVPNRPASLSLDLDGAAWGLQAAVRTSEGQALHLLDTGGDRGGELRLAPGNLTNGTYRVSLDADRLEGRLVLTTRTLPVEDPERPEAPDERIERMGSLVARVQAGQAWQVPVPASETLTLAIEEGAWADARVYSPEDHLVHRVGVGQEGPSWSWSSNESSRPAYHVVRLDVRQGTHTVYVDRIQAEADASVYVLLEDRERSPPGRVTEIRTRTLEVSYPAMGSTSLETLHYAGGLVDVRLAGGDGVAVDRSLAVEGPSGIVLERHDQAAGESLGVLTDRIRHLENFGPGPLEVSLEAEAGEGSVRLEVQHYVP